MARIDYKKRKEHQTEVEIANSYSERAKRMNKQGDIVFFDAEFWDDKDNTFFRGSEFKIPAGNLSIDKWIKDSELEKCKKSEAVSLLIVGEKKEGCWLIGKCKNYWLRPKQ